MSRRTIGKSSELWVLFFAAKTSDTDLAGTNIDACEDFHIWFGAIRHLIPQAWIRLGLGSPTLSNLSRRPCECRLMWPRILHGVRKGRAGGLSIIQAAELTRLRLRSASRRNPSESN